MSLPARQQQILNKIEASLHASDPALKAMFATFTRLTSPEAVPATEAIRRKLPRLLMPRVLVLGAMVVAVLSAVLLGAFTPGPSCGRMPARGGAVHSAVWVVGCRTGTAAGTGSGH